MNKTYLRLIAICNGPEFVFMAVERDREGFEMKGTGAGSDTMIGGTDCIRVTGESEMMCFESVEAALGIYTSRRKLHGGLASIALEWILRGNRGLITVMLAIPPRMIKNVEQSDIKDVLRNIVETYKGNLSSIRTRTFGSRT